MPNAIQSKAEDAVILSCATGNPDVTIRIANRCALLIDSQSPGVLIVSILDFLSRSLCPPWKNACYQAVKSPLSPSIECILRADKTSRLGVALHNDLQMLSGDFLHSKKYWGLIFPASSIYGLRTARIPAALISTDVHQELYL